MSGPVNPSPAVPATPKTKVFVAVLRFLARSVLAIFLLSLFAALLPLQLQSPLWYMKAGQVAVDYSVTLLFAIFLFFLVEYLRSREESLGRQRSPALVVSLIAILIYGLLIPVMLFAYGLYWLQTGEQTKQALSQAQSQVATLQKRIRGAKTDRELVEIISPGRGGASPAEAPSLMPQKEKLSREVGARLVQLRGNLVDRRQSQLALLALVPPREWLEPLLSLLVWSPSDQQSCCRETGSETCFSATSLLGWSQSLVAAGWLPCCSKSLAEPPG